MLTQELTNHRRAARARAFAHAQSTPSQLEALNAQVASLQQTVFTLQTQVDALREDLAAVQSNNVQALDPFVSVDPNPELGVAGPHIIFSGANTVVADAHLRDFLENFSPQTKSFGVVR